MTRTTRPTSRSAPRQPTRTSSRRGAAPGATAPGNAAPTAAAPTAATLAKASAVAATATASPEHAAPLTAAGSTEKPFVWFRPPPEEGWEIWQATVPTARVGNHAGIRDAGLTGMGMGALECAAWVHQGTAPRPLVIVLQGCGQGPDEIDDEHGWYAAAEARRFSLMFVRETGGSRAGGLWWSPATHCECFDWYDLEGARNNEGQPGGFLTALDLLQAAHPTHVDRRQVYIVGFSAGGGMAALLLTAWPERFAGAGLIAAPTIGIAETAAGAWSIYTAPQLMYWPETMRRWASDLRAQSCRSRQVRPHRYRHKISIWQGESDPVVNRGHSIALVDQFAGMMEIPVSRQWSWFLPRVEVSGQSASHIRRPLTESADGRRRTLHRAVFTRDGEALIQANWIDMLGHAVPVAPRRRLNGEPIGETDRRKWVGVDSTTEILDFFGIG